VQKQCAFHYVVATRAKSYQNDASRIFRLYEARRVDDVFDRFRWVNNIRFPSLSRRAVAETTEVDA
jgi:hypothetical protein